MARALALGRHPDPGLASWGEWKAGLEARLLPMSELFRCPIPGPPPPCRSGPQLLQGKFCPMLRRAPFVWRPGSQRRPGP
jgi:hypothetical protein